MSQNKAYASSTTIEKFIELCDEFLKDFFDAKRPNVEELRKEWFYFKFLLSNRNLEKSKIEDYFSILKDKMLFNKGYQTTQLVTKPYGVENNSKMAYNMKREEYGHKMEETGMKKNDKLEANGGYADEIYEIFRKNNEEIDKYVYRRRLGRNEPELNVNDFIEEITQKYR